MHVEKRSPLTPVHIFIIFTLALALALWVTLTVTFRAREYVKPSSCSNNVFLIIKCCHLYADDNDGQWPERLSQLYPKYVKDYYIFNCPSAVGPRVQTPEDIDTKTSYLYFPVRAGQPFAGVIEERPGNHQRGRNVGIVSGSVEWLREEDEQKLRELKSE